jgi:transposase
MRGGPVADRRLDPAALHPTATFVDGWLQARPRDWLAQVGTVALDPRRGYASALVAPLGHVTVLGDHVHAIRLANAVTDQARRQVKQVTLGHRPRSVIFWQITGKQRQEGSPESHSCWWARQGLNL